MPALEKMNDNEFDLAICDPPYGIGVNKGQEHTRLNRVDRRNGKPISIKQKNYGIKEWDIKPDQSYFKELTRVSKNQIIWGANNFVLPASTCWIVWDKVNGESDFSDCELAYTSFKTAVRMVSFMWSGMIQASSIERGKIMEGNVNKREKRIHPTQKPIQLYKWILKNYAKTGNTILDTHLGSGSIAIACYDMGFDLTGYEIDKDYFTAMQKRIKEHTDQLTLV